MASQVLVIGAGLAGLISARSLVEAGHEVHVVDKGRSVGGRLATRRVGGGVLDHGAQFFTVRTPDFGALVEDTTADGVTYEWCRGFSDGGDGFPRYAARGGMNQLAKALAADLDISVGTQITSVTARRGRWTARSDGAELAADALVLTAPIPQSLSLLDAGGCPLDPDLRARLDAVSYHPTLALLTLLDGAPSLPASGAVQLTDGPFSFIADNKVKGISPTHAVTFHAAHDLSSSQWDDDDEVVRDDLLELGRPWLGDAEPTEVQLKRWRYAQPVEPAEYAIESTTVEGAPLVFAGDAFAGAKVEGAYRSGRAAARDLHARLEAPR